MSRSFKKNPFQAITGANSAHYDKKLASRGVRRRFNIYLKTHTDYDTFLSPHDLECTHNNTYDWNRDGKQYYQGLDARDWYRYLDANDPTSWLYEYKNRWYSMWPPKWYLEMMRK